jgi:hypothetical protein
MAVGFVLSRVVRFERVASVNRDACFHANGQRGLLGRRRKAQFESRRGGPRTSCYVRPMHLEPSDENARRFFERQIDGPVTMLNLLRFREQADYTEFPHLASPEPISGSEAYDRYVRHTIPFLTASGGSIEFFGRGGHNFVGPGDERWDLVMLVRQSSVDDFLALASNDEYLAGIGHRTAAVEDSRLLPIVDRPLP